MAINVVGRSPWTNAQRGVDSPELGISVRRFAVRYFLEVNERLQDNNGQVIARAMATLASREITIEGEMTGTAGLMNLAWGVSVQIIQNEINQWPSQGPTAPWIFMDEVTETQERAGWRSINMRLSSNPELHQ
jgi:hypothetical protein